MATTKKKTGSTGPKSTIAVNEVRLRGTVSTPGTARELPSGDTIVTFRITVRRGSSPGTRSSRQPVDVVDCVAWSATARRAAARLEVGDVAEVTGALRRRFYRHAHGTGSRVEVEVQRISRPRPLIA